MKELSLNVLDVAGNSVKAKATEIDITVDYQFCKNLLTIEIVDNGCGMSEEFLKRVTDPFTTTRTTRKVGLGLPLFRLSAEQSGGNFEIKSALGVGTTVKATYQIDNIDRMPMGDLTGTILLLINANDKIRYKLNYIVDEDKFEFDTKQVMDIMGEVAISEPEVVTFLKDYISQGIKTINGGKKVI